MSLLNKFGLNKEAFGAFSEDNLSERTGSTRLMLDKRVRHNGSINGIEVPCYVTLKSARLTRLSLIKQQQIASGRDYWLVTGILKPVTLDIEAMIDGELINLTELMQHIVQEASGEKLTNEEFLMKAEKWTFKYDEGMPLFFQQFGASLDGFTTAINAFKEAGAQDVMGKMTNTGRFHAAYEHRAGVPVTSFELGSVDRSKSPRNMHFPNAPQGFLNLIDAHVSQYERILKLRKDASVIQQEIANAEGWSQDKIKKAHEKAKTLDDMSRQWTSSWSGAQKRIVNKNGTYVEENTYDPVNAPCGRLAIVVNGTETEIDLWSNSANANTVNVTPSTEKKNPF